MQLSFALSLSSFRLPIRRLISNFFPLGSTGLITADGKIFLAREVGQ